VLLDKKLVAPIDAHDNGIDLVDNKYKEISPYIIQSAFYSMKPTWRESVNEDQMFPHCVGFAKNILRREIIQANDALLAEEAVIDIYKNTKDKRILVLDTDYPFQYTLQSFSEPLFVVYPRATNDNWGVKAVKADPKTFNNRKDFPQSWAGLRDEELQKVTGVSDAIFCHRELFLAVAKSREGAIKLAELALK
jgi:uncharacterized UPF0160 family protein